MYAVRLIIEIKTALDIHAVEMHTLSAVFRFFKVLLVTTLNVMMLLFHFKHVNKIRNSDECSITLVVFTGKIFLTA